MNELYSEKPESYYSDIRHSLIKLIPQGPNKVLEFGCAKGFTLLAAKEAGKASEIVGIDILPTEHSHGLLDNYIQNESDGIAIDYPFEYFDVILCADVLEHLINPWQVVKELKSYLKPGGMLIASIPNIRFYKTMLVILLQGEFRYDDNGEGVDKTHLRFFCKRNMKELFTRNGFSIGGFHCKMSLLYRVLTFLTVGFLEEFFVRQYTIVARKPYSEHGTLYSSPVKERPRKKPPQVNSMNTNSNYLNMRLSANRLFAFCISIFPLCLLTFDFWINGTLFICSALSIYIIIKAGVYRVSIIPENISRRWLFLLISVLASPIVAVFLGQCFRLEFSWRYYDSPSRFLICIPILLAFVHLQLNVARLINYTITGAIFAALASTIMHPNITWGSDRLTTYFVDPLTFGSLSLTLGLLSLVLINLNEIEPIVITVYKLMGFGIGIYLSVLSGSRTGWFALPFVIFIWLLFKDTNRKIISSVYTVGVTIVLLFAVYYNISIIQQRLAVFVNELISYHWNELNPDGSIPMRISFCRMAFSLFLQNPFGGWGDSNFLHAVNTSEFARYATQYTREFVKNGFHNEIMTNMVRSGIWGMIASSSLFIVPAIFFIRGLRAIDPAIRNSAMLGCSYLICTIVSGMSTEVFNLKFTASFHALFITCLTGSLLVLLNSSEKMKKQGAS